MDELTVDQIEEIIVDGISIDDYGVVHIEGLAQKIYELIIKYEGIGYAQGREDEYKNIN